MSFNAGNQMKKAVIGSAGLVFMSTSCRPHPESGVVSTGWSSTFRRGPPCCRTSDVRWFRFIAGHPLGRFVPLPQVNSDHFPGVVHCGNRIAVPLASQC